MLDAFDCRELRPQHVDDRGRQRGNRACSACDEHIAVSCCSVERADSADVRSRISEIYIVSTRFDACLGNQIVLSLKWTGRVNNYVRFQPPQLRRKIRRATIQRRRFCGQTYFICNRLRLLQIATRDDDATGAISGERCDNPSAEIAVPAENDCTAHAMAQCRNRSAMSAVGTRHAARLPNMR